MTAPAGRTPLDRLLAATVQAGGSYRLVPGIAGQPDCWLCTCPCAPDAGMHMLVTDRGEGEFPGIACRFACCRSQSVARMLGLDASHEAKAAAYAEVMTWATSYRAGRRRR